MHQPRLRKEVRLGVEQLRRMPLPQRATRIPRLKEVLDLLREGNL